MRIQSLSLRNIGPFIEADMEFMSDADEKPPVVLITGENGTGKSLILDAIRSKFRSDCYKLKRNILRRKEKYSEIEIIRKEVEDDKNWPNWIADFWASTSASRSYKIKTMKDLNHKELLLGALQGQRNKSDITQLIYHVIYMRGSHKPEEKETGERLYQILEKIIEKSLLNGGKPNYAFRTAYEPIVIQNDQAVSLENLSSGNSYLIQNMVSLLGKMYSVHFLRKTPLEELCKTPGLLLIDEVENQLHPKWQKRLIPTILEIFPNLQIIATTHSPFIISSVPNARLFVCKSKTDHCVVEDETAQYANKPIDEILMSPLFEETQPFNEDISNLIRKRKRAIESGDKTKRDEIEEKLKAINPDYFSYFDTDKLLEELERGGTDK